MSIDWGDTPAWVALAVAVWAAVEAHRSRKASQESAKASKRSAAAGEASASEAKRSADAGELSAQASVRSADAAEKANQLADQQYRDSLPPPVGWEIQHVHKSKFQLVNVGTETATGVTLNPSGVPLIRQPPQDVTIRGNGGYVEFLMAGSNDGPIPTEIEVSWDGPGSPAIVPVQKL